MSTVNPKVSNRSSSEDGETSVHGALEQAKQHYAQAEAAVKEKTQNAAMATERYIDMHPWTSLAVAGSIGMVIGILLRRR